MWDLALFWDGASLLFTAAGASLGTASSQRAGRATLNPPLAEDLVTLDKGVTMTLQGTKETWSQMQTRPTSPKTSFPLLGLQGLFHNLSLLSQLAGSWEHWTIYLSYLSSWEVAGWEPYKQKFGLCHSPVPWLLLGDNCRVPVSYTNIHP